MGLFGKKEKPVPLKEMRKPEGKEKPKRAPKEPKSNCFYGERLEEKTAQKLLKRATVLGGLPDPCKAQMMLCSAGIPGLSSYAICTDTELVYLPYTSTGFKVFRYSLHDITSVSVAGRLVTSDIVISVGGSRDIALEIKAIRPDMDVFYDHLRGAIDNVRSAGQAASDPAVSCAADEIRKYKELLDIGAITQDEFDAKKKQLLGL